MAVRTEEENYRSSWVEIENGQFESVSDNVRIRMNIVRGEIKVKGKGAGLVTDFSRNRQSQT